MVPQDIEFNESENKGRSMGLFSSFSSLSGWYRLLVVASVLWIIFTASEIEPWRGGWNNLDDFLLYGILPAVALCGLLWIIQGFKQR